jgi:hypothetical protein
MQRLYDIDYIQMFTSSMTFYQTWLV